ncbi:MAG: M48 family metallopeptidase, partial [Spirulinaceae cyanobacterium]
MLEQIFSPFWRSRRRWLYGLVAVISAFSFSVATPQPGYSASWLELLLRGIQIIQLSNISNNQEVDLGKRINQQISRQVPISRNKQLTSYINEIGQNLAANSTRTDIPYTFQVVEDKSINAFATMGGFAYVHTGLINAADNEAELASVMAHEIAHVTARHAVNQMKESAIQQGILSAAGLDRSQAVQIGVQLALSLPNSRSDELEADELGLNSLVKTGYAPIGAVTFMKKLQQKSSGAPPEFLSTHPHT